MLNAVRANIYLSKYFNLLNKYNKNLRTYLSTYFIFDYKNSVYDKDILRYGSYERIGNFSGLKWIKVNNFPLAFSTETHPIMQQNQYGVFSQNETTAVFPYISFSPTTLDFIVFNIDTLPTNHVYQVTHFEQGYIEQDSTSKIFKVTLKLQWFDITLVENQLSNNVTYNEIFDAIFATETSNLITDCFVKLNSICTDITNFIEQSSGFLISRSL